MNDKEFLAGIGQRIKKIRIEKNIPQYTLAAMCDFEKASLSRIESGKTNATVLTLRKISTALGVQVARFFED